MYRNDLSVFFSLSLFFVVFFRLRSELGVGRFLCVSGCSHASTERTTELEKLNLIIIKHERINLGMKRNETKRNQAKQQPHRNASLARTHDIKFIRCRRRRRWRQPSMLPTNESIPFFAEILSHCSSSNSFRSVRHWEKWNEFASDSVNHFYGIRNVFLWRFLLSCTNSLVSNFSSFSVFFSIDDGNSACFFMFETNRQHDSSIQSLHTKNGRRRCRLSSFRFIENEPTHDAFWWPFVCLSNSWPNERTVEYEI